LGLEVSFGTLSLLAMIGSVSAALWVKCRGPKSLLPDIE
jgi:hypothetical protein